MSRRRIERSVGEKGANQWLDVRTVQELLHFVPITEGGPVELAVDGLCGPQTRQAIHAFQLHHFGWSGADGRVDPDKQSMQKLKAYEKQNGLFDFSVCRLDLKQLPRPRDWRTDDTYYLFRDSRGHTALYWWGREGQPPKRTVPINKCTDQRQWFKFRTEQPRTAHLFQSQAVLHSSACGTMDNQQLDKARIWLGIDQNWELILINFPHRFVVPAAHAYVVPNEWGRFHVARPVFG